MSFIGKLHEISLYGLIINIVSLVCNKVSFRLLWNTAFHVKDFATFFYAYLFWASVLFVPIAIIGAFSTKYVDGGEGLTFDSDNIVVIMFAHIAEELQGLILTPFWFLKDLFTHKLNGFWKILDYVMYAVELMIILEGVICVIL